MAQQQSPTSSSAIPAGSNPLMARLDALNAVSSPAGVPGDALNRLSGQGSSKEQARRKSASAKGRVVSDVDPDADLAGQDEQGLHAKDVPEGAVWDDSVAASARDGDAVVIASNDTATDSAIGTATTAETGGATATGTSLLSSATLFSPAVLGGVGLGVVALAASGGGGGSKSEPVVAAAPAPVTVASPTEVKIADTNGDKQPNISGNATSGALITIKDPTGATHTVTAGSNGHFEMEIPLPSKPLGTWEVTASDGSGNVSKPASVVVTDLTAPDIPIIDFLNDSVGSQHGAMPDGSLTNDARATITGTAEANSVVTLRNAGVWLGTATADASGVWTFTPPAGTDKVYLKGLNQITAQATDASGNVSRSSDVFKFTLDDVAPEPAKILSFTDDVAPFTGPIVEGSLTDDARPTLTGLGEVDALVFVHDGEKQVGAGVVGPDGYWKVEVSAGDGLRNLTVTLVDAAGNVSQEVHTVTFNVDTVKPPVPTIVSATQMQGSTSKDVPKGSITNDAQPVFTGTEAEVGTTILLMEGNTTLGTAKVGESGTWSIVPTIPLGLGVRHIVAVAMDPAGNKSAPSSAYDVVVVTGGTSLFTSITTVIDDTVPNAVVVVHQGGATKDLTPTVQGTAIADSIVTLYSDTLKIGTAIADKNGLWSITPLPDMLKEGAHAFTAKSTDAQGRVSDPSNVYQIVIDITAPGKIDKLVVTDDVPEKVGPIADGDVTDDATPTFAGTGEPGAIVYIREGSLEVGSTRVKLDGTWTITPTSAMAPGPHDLLIVAVDPAGNIGRPTAFSFTVDLSTARVSIDSVYDAKAPKTGFVSMGSATDDQHPVVSGKANAGGTVTLYDGDKTVLGTAVAGPDGRWSITSATLDPGSHVLTASVTTAAGKVETTGPFPLVIDIHKTATPLINAAEDNEGPIKGLLTNGQPTDDTTPELRGTTEPGSTVAVFEGEKRLGDADVDKWGNWKFTPTTPLNPGKHDITVIATDGVGIVSEPSQPWSVVIDKSEPTKITTIEAVTDNQEPDVGRVDKGTTTNDARPVVSGTAQAGTTVALFDGTEKIGSAIANGDGVWSITPTKDLINGAHHLTAIASTPVGTPGQPSAAYDFSVLTGGVPTGIAITDVLDDTGPAVRTIARDGLTKDRTPTVEGTARKGELVTLYSETNEVLGTAVVGADGHWRITSTVELSAGSHGLRAVATDPLSGRSGTPTAAYPITLDFSTEAAKNLTLTDHVGPKTGAINEGETTDDSTPTFAGTAEPGATITVKDGEVELGTTKVKPDGTWSFTHPLKDGHHALTATVTDEAGNVAAPEKSIGFYVKAGAGDVLVSINEVYDAVPLLVGPVEFGGVTNDSHPKVSGRATPGGTVTLYADGKKIDTVVADAHTGQWTVLLTNSDALKNDGLHMLTATVTPPGGVASEPTQFDLIVDHTPPGEAHIEKVLDKVGSVRGPVPDGGATDDTTPTLSGVADANSKVTIFNNGEWMAEADADEYGNWHVTPTTAWNPGTHSLTLTSTDKAGNVTATTKPWTVIVDVEAPAIPKIDRVMDNREPEIGQVTPGTSMNDPEPVVIGTAEKGVMVTLWDGADKLGSAITDTITGIWSIHVDHFLLNGEHLLTATAADVVGNTSKPSDPFAFTLTAGAVPPPPAITNVIDDDNVDGVDRNIQPGGYTNDKTPTVIGTATAGSTVTLYDENHKELGSAISDSHGYWRIVSATLDKGAHTLLATAIDPATKVAQSTSSFLLNIDVDAPKVLGDLSLFDNVGPDVGQILNGKTTDDKTPTFSGTGEAGATVEVWDGKERLGSTLVKPDGTWSFTPELENGIHSLTATQTDAAGNVSTPTAPKTFYVDDGKVQVSIDLVYDNVAPVVGPVMPGTSTNDRRPVISGKATRGGVVTLYEGNEVLGATIADERTGEWSIRAPEDLAKGTHVFDATVTPSSGIESPKTSVSFVVDFAGPPQPKITMISDNVGPIQGDHTDGRPLTTDDTTPILRGTAEPNCVIAIFVNGERMDVNNEVKSDTQGAWHYTLASGLSTGNNSIYVIAIDDAGNVSEKSNPWAVIIDISKVDPGTGVIPSIETVWNDQGSTPVKVLFGTTTNDDTPTFKGKGDPDTVVVLMDGLERLGTANVGKDGTWEFTPTGSLKNGQHHVTAATLSPTGNAGTASPVFEFNLLSGGVPTGTAITSVFDDTNVDSLVYIERDGYTRDTTPVVKGTALAGTTVRLYNESAELLGTGIAGADGQWRIVVAGDHALSEGIHALRAVATDSLGRSSDPTGPYGLTVDLKAPILSNTVLNDDVGPKTGAIKNGDVTDDSTPTFTGKGEPGAQVTVVLDGVENLGTTEVKPDGTWTLPSKVLLEGPHTLSVTSVDKAGNVSDPVTVNFVVDQSVLTISLDSIDDAHDPVLGPLKQGEVTNDQRPTVIGRTSANTVVKVYDETNGQLGSVVSDSRGDWQLRLSVPLDPGQHTLYATATKSTGEVATSNSFAFEIDILPPKAPTIDGNDDDVGQTQGGVANGAPTDDTTPTLSGTAEAKAKIILYEGTKEVGRAEADAYGNWHTTLQTPLNQGTHPIVAVATDRAGNLSPNSNEWKVVIDISIPNPPTITTVVDSQGPSVGPLASGDTTDETRPSVSGKADPGVTVTLWDGSERLGSAIADPVTGAWTIKPEGSLINGDHHLTAVSTNPAGSVSKPSAAFDLHVFAGGSATATAITNVVDDSDPNHHLSIPQGALTSDPTPTVNGTAQAGATVRLYDKDGSLLGTTIATPAGEWHITTPTLAPGGHEVTAESTAANGDILARTGPRSFLVDTHVPGAADNLKLYDDQQPDVGDIVQHGVTDDSTPTFSGTTQEAFGTITIYDGVKQVGTTKADAVGNWSFTHYLPDGSHSYTATVTDVAGKTGPATKAIDFVVKTADVVVSIDQVLDKVPPITGPVAPGGVTDDQFPTVSGKATRGGLVTLYDGIGKQIGTATADIHTGKWTIQVDAQHKLEPGEHLLRATVTPVGGVESAAQPFAFTVDIKAPAVPEIQSIVDDVGNTTGPMSQNTNTDDVTPTLYGKGDPNTTVAILEDGKEVGRAEVNGGGQWSFTVDAPPVSPGTHTFTAVGIDKAGNTSKESPAWALIFDTSGTKLPTGLVDPLSNNIVAVTYITRDTGGRSDDFVTSDNTLVFGGITDAVDGSRVDVRLDGKHLAYVTVTGHTWSYDHTRVVLDDGNHFVRADLVDLADNVAKSSDPQRVVVDTHGDKLPDGTRDPLIDKAIAVTAVTRDSGISPVDFITNDPTLVFYGTSNAADGTYVALYVNGRFVDHYAQVFGGLWSYDYTGTPLAIGKYDVRAYLVDLAGNLAVASEVKPLEIDIFGDRFSNGTHDPLADQTISVTKIVVDSGISDSDFITNSPRLVISGVSSAPDDSNVAVWVNGEFLAYRKVTNGTWSYDYTAKELDPGYYDVRADLVDVAGNIAVSSPVRRITMDRSGSEFADGTHDTLADHTIAVTAIIEDNGVRNDDFYTRDRTLVFSGTSNAPDRSHVAVWLNGNFLAYVEVIGGAWRYDYTARSLDDGYYKLQADLVDVAGNIAVASLVKDFAIDNSGALMPDGTRDLLADAAIAVTSIVTDSGVSDSDFITNATHVDAHGTGRANAWIQVFLDDKYLGNQQIDGSGNWTYGLDTPQGNHTIKAHYIDLAENVVPGPVASHDMTVDTTAPTLQIQLPAGTAKGAETVYFNFSEGVSGFDASDVTLSKATLTDFKMIDAAHYSATIKPTGSGTGTLSLSVANNLYTDVAGNNGTGDSQSQAYYMGPPDPLDLGIWGQGILPWQVPGTNKVFYYLDSNRDGQVDRTVRSGYTNSGDDFINYDELKSLFNGGADLDSGRYSNVVNGNKITLLGGDYGTGAAWNTSMYGYMAYTTFDQPKTYTTTHEGIAYEYNDPDDFSAVEYMIDVLLDKSKDADQFYFWTGSQFHSSLNPSTDYQRITTTGVDGTRPVMVPYDTPRHDQFWATDPNSVANLLVVFMYEMPII